MFIFFVFSNLHLYFSSEQKNIKIIHENKNDDFKPSQITEKWKYIKKLKNL